MAPSVSVLCNSFRPGGLDVTFRGLRDQTCTDFELILVDRRYEKRHDQVLQLARETGVPTIHAPEHRRNGKWAVLAAAWNTALMLARGRYVVFLPDYTYVPPEWIAQHLEMQSLLEAVLLAPFRMFYIPPVVDREGTPVTPVGPEELGALCPKVREMPDDRFDEISIFPEPFDPAWIPGLVPWPDGKQDVRRDLKLLAGLPPMHGHFHMRNESLPRAWALEVNGFDEMLDRGKHGIDREFARRLALTHPVFPTLGPMISMLDPHGLFPTMPQRGVGRWTPYQCDVYIESLQGTMPLNPHDLLSRGAALAPWRTLPRIPTEGLDVPDAEYYR